MKTITKNLKNVTSIITLALVLLVSVNVSAQKKVFDINNYITKTSKVVSEKDSKLRTSISQSNKFTVDESEQPIQYNTNNGYEIIVLPVIDNSTAMINNSKSKLYSYTVFNPKESGNSTFFVSKTEGSIKVMNSDLVELYTIIKEGEKGRMVLNTSSNGISSKTSPFQDCMAAAEEAITEDFIGWLAWNYSPGVQIAVAISCL